MHAAVYYIFGLQWTLFPPEILLRKLKPWLSFPRLARNYRELEKFKANVTMATGIEQTTRILEEKPQFEVGKNPSVQLRSRLENCWVVVKKIVDNSLV